MPVQNLTFESEPKIMAGYTEDGVSKKYTLVADARIKTEEDALGIGPVAYRGQLKNNQQVVDTKTGVPRDLCVFFFTDTDVRRASLEAMDPADVDDTINDFLTTCGADPATMLTKAPAIG